MIVVAFVAGMLLLALFGILLAGVIELARHGMDAGE